jgi:hypothetical protein
MGGDGVEYVQAGPTFSPAPRKRAKSGKSIRNSDEISRNRRGKACRRGKRDGKPGADRAEVRRESDVSLRRETGDGAMFHLYAPFIFA